MASTQLILKDAPERIRPPLEQLRSIIRRYVGLEGACVIGIFLALWFWIGLAIDFGSFKLLAFDWVQELPRWVRGGALSAAMATVAVIVLRKLVRRLRVDFAPSSLALVLEKRFPNELGDRLITAVELSDVRRAEEVGYSRAMIAETVREAAERVAALPVATVFDWRRLKKLGAWCLGLLLGPALVIGIGYTAVRRTNPFSDYLPRLREVSTTWIRRNVLMQDVIWPRRAYLEILDFPASGDLRIGRDAPSPRLRFKARRWIVADASAPEGWRPMLWTDLTEQMLGAAPPAFPARLFTDHPSAVQAASIVAAPGWLPVPMANASSSSDAWKLDRIEFVLEDAATRQRLQNVDAETVSIVLETIERLQRRASEPGTHGLFRRLDVPERVEVRYWGEQTSGRLELLRGPGWEYAGVLGDLKESVRFRARGADYFTATRSITLVPPPALQVLKRIEYRPAYLYHRPPTDGRAEFLKGRRQRIEDFISLNGPTSRFAVPAGTDVILDGQLDKELRSIALRPRGKSLESEAASPVNVPVESDRISFRQRFESLNAPLDFDLEFCDTDGVRSSRHVLMDVVRDQPPVVNVVIDGIRLMKQGHYLATPQAMIPFDGKVVDGIAGALGGLKSVEYQLTLTRLESTVISATQAEWLTLAAVPMIGGQIDSWHVNAVAVSEVARQIQSTATPPIERAIPLETFEQAARAKGIHDYTGAELAAQLELNPNPPPFIKDFAVRPKFEGLDLRSRLPDLKVKSELDIQPRYRMKVTVVAADNNVETGPGIGSNKEPPFIVLIVSEPELLVEVALDEEKQHLKTEDAIQRLRESKQKLEKTAGELPAASNEQLPTLAQRAQEVGENLVKARDTLQEVSTEYHRILRELELNRVAAKIVEKVKGEICLPLESTLRVDVTQAEEAIEEFRRELEAGRKPSDAMIKTAIGRLDRLIEKLLRIMAAMGDVTTINKLIATLREIEKGQEQAVGARLKELQRMQREKLIRDLDKLKGLEDK